MCNKNTKPAPCAQKHGQVEHAKSEPCRMYTVDMDSVFVHLVAAVLAGASGAVDAIAFIMFGCFIANQSGNVIQVGMRSADETVGSPIVAAQLVGSFMLGCMICGLIIPKRRPKFPVGDDLYTIAFFLQAIFLIFTSYTKHTVYGKYMGCIACGLMNSITTSWSDGPMRTTHATGPSTEVGLNLGRMIALFLFYDLDEDSKAEMMANFRKFKMNVVLVFSFAVGGYLGSILYSQIGGDALLLPALLSIGVAVLNLALPAVDGEPECPYGHLTEPLLAEVSGCNSSINQHNGLGKTHSSSSSEEFNGRYKLYSSNHSRSGSKDKPDDAFDSDDTSTLAASSNWPSLLSLASSLPSGVFIHDPESISTPYHAPDTALGA